MKSAKDWLEEYLDAHHPDFRTLNKSQARELLSLQTFKVWMAWTKIAHIEGID